MLALGVCVSALALPAAAAAQPLQYTPPTTAVTTHHPHGRPAAFAGSTITAGTGRQADVPRHKASPAPTSSVIVREVRTITQGSDHTLALVLASAALGIALCGTAFAVVRTARIQRRVLGSNS
jgi:uncharacterized protein HemX